MKKFRLSKGLRKIILTIFLVSTLAGTFSVAPSKPAQAGSCECIISPGCAIYDCWIAQLFITLFHDLIGEPAIKKVLQQTFKKYRDWFVSKFFELYVLPDLMQFTQQMSAVSMQQAMIVGMFLDAQHQLETQRLLNQLKNEAHRDYQPSEDFCWFGTNVRSMAATEARSRYHAQALSARQMARHLGNVSQAGADKAGSDKSARWEKFTKVYCDPQDNNWAAGGSGLQSACGAGGGNTARVNLDIDYTRLIDNPRTRVINFNPTPDREDVLSMAANLYGHNVLTRNIESDYFDKESYQGLYLALRSVVARRNVAENSYNAVVELKSAGTSDLPHKISHTREFMAALLTEMGVPDDEVFEYLGERPSYYAQLELMAKKIYQNPDFYANLYDKPANVARKSVALKAIELMLDRAIYESELRQEMVSSVLLSTTLDGEFQDVNEKLLGGGKD